MNDDNEFWTVVAACAGWRRRLLRRWWGFADVDAVITATLWEQHRGGVRDLAVLESAATVAVRRMVRAEMRDHRVRAAAGARGEAVVSAESCDGGFDAVTDRIDAAAALSGVCVPVQAQPWVRSVVWGAERSDAERKAGERWAKRCRTEMDPRRGVA